MMKEYNYNSILDNNDEIQIDGTQIEIDALYESSKYIVNIELKVVPQEEFNMRQLYYPYLKLINNEEIKKSGKEIHNLFIIYNQKTDMITINEFEFGDNIFDFRLVNAVNYTFKNILSKDIVSHLMTFSNINKEQKALPHFGYKELEKYPKPVENAEEEIKTED